MSASNQGGAVSHGVEALIDRLRAEGVEAGRAEAQALRVQAETEAAALLAAAREEAVRLRAEAETEVARLHRSAEEALRTAMGRVVLELRDQLLERFSDDVRRLVAGAMEDRDLLDRIILEIAAGARDAAGLAPGEPVSALLGTPLEADLRGDLDALRASPLTQLTLAGAGRILAEGAALGRRDGVSAGVILQFRDGDVEIDLSAAQVAALLLEHLQPRFRALFEGVIR